MGSHLKMMCCHSAILILRASWNTFSSSHLGLTILSSSAILLCSLTHKLCMLVSIGCSLALKSPATKVQPLHSSGSPHDSGLSPLARRALHVGKRLPLETAKS